MKNVLKMLPKNPSYLVLSLLMMVFIVVDIAPPSNICMLVDTIVGKAVVIMVALGLFSLNTLLGIVGIVAAYILIMRCFEFLIFIILSIKLLEFGLVLLVPLVS